MAESGIPQEMRRLVVTSPGTGAARGASILESVADITVEVETLPTPVPAAGEVLIKVAAAPINPSDYANWFNTTVGAVAASFPMPMGKEGSGVVVASGGGTDNSIDNNSRTTDLTPTKPSASWWSLLDCCGPLNGEEDDAGVRSAGLKEPASGVPVGSSVGFSIVDGKQGTYSEYVTKNAREIFPLPADVPVEDCASFMVNPYTAVGILDTAKREGSSKAIVHTAAASNLGQMLVKLAPLKGVEVINVVRREDQKELLEKLGAKHVIVTSGEVDKWKAELKDKIDALGATAAFDAVAGEMTGHLVEVLPSKGIVYTYGFMGGNPSNINPADLIYREKSVKGFFMTAWLREGGPAAMMGRIATEGKVVNEGLRPDGWARTTFKDTTMEKAHEDLVEQLKGSVTGQKLRILF